MKPAEELPGKNGLPLIGEVIEIFRTQELYYWKCFQDYGSIFKTKAMGMKVAVLIGPDANQLVLKEQVEKFSSRAGWAYLEPILGEGILLQDGNEHQTIRKLMYPAFHGKAIAYYFDTIVSTTEYFFKDWVERSPIILFDEFRRLTLIIACRLFLGANTNEEIREISQWFSDFFAGQLTILRLNSPLTKFGRALRARQKLEAFVDSAIQQRRHQGNLNECQDVLGLLLTATDEEGNHLSDSEIIEQTILLLFAGHETTAKLLSWLLFELAAHPQWVERLREEQNLVMGEQPLAPSHLKQMTQMSYVLKEIERLYPPVYVIPRGVVQDVEFAGYHIPAGWLLNICPMLTHRMSELYSAPDQFDPERFAPPREEHKRHPFALIGFGGGPHKCIGYELAQMESKIVLSTLLRHFDWNITPEYSTVAPVRQPSKIERMLRAQVVRASPKLIS